MIFDLYIILSADFKGNFLSMIQVKYTIEPENMPISPSQSFNFP